MPPETSVGTSDIPLLAWHFLKKHAARAGKDVLRLAPEVLEALSVAPWTGNVLARPVPMRFP